MRQRLPPLPDPPELLNIRLDSLGDIRREMAAVYRETRSKRMHPAVASRLIYMLTTLTATLLAERRTERSFNPNELPVPAVSASIPVQ